MARAYPDHPHPSHRQYIQHVGNAGEYRIPAMKPPRGWVLSRHPHRVRIPWLFLARVSPAIIPTVTNNICVSGIGPCVMCTRKPYKKSTLLQTLGYNVVEMWGMRMGGASKKRLLTSKRLWIALNSSEPLNPRDAFCGGRTNAVKLYHRVTPGQKIHYIDYTSLYPWVNKTCCVPQRTSSLHLAIGSHRHQPLLWSHPMPNPPSA